MKPNGRTKGWRRFIHFFVYGTLRERADAGTLLDDCDRVRSGAVTGMLFDLGSYPALVLAGRGRVRGEVWRCPPEAVARLDEYEGVAEGLFRRVGVEVGGQACWTYVAGPALVRRLRPEHRIDDGVWPPEQSGE